MVINRGHVDLGTNVRHTVTSSPILHETPYFSLQDEEEGSPDRCGAFEGVYPQSWSSKMGL